MPIPDFDHNNVLPPHLGNPVLKSELSPYPCTILELCTKFSTSPERIEILKNFVQFRKKMTINGVLFGFQWLDGSFLENIEISQNRPPRDLDLVTFYGNISPTDQANISVSFPEFINPILSKTNFLLDHYPADITYNPIATVEITRYWLQLFSHNRNSVWKGILQLPLNSEVDDQYALDYLNNLN
jgi:hypothetical protein